MPARTPVILDDLRRRVARLEHLRPEGRRVLPFGLAALDGHLPGGGLRLGALHEVAGGSGDVTHGAAASLFVAGILARLEGPVLWCVERQDLFAPALAGVGLDPGRVIFVETGKAKNVLSAMEEGAREKGLSGVVGEVSGLDLVASRRLSLAAEGSGALILALRRWPQRQDREEQKPNAAVSRWRIAASPEEIGPAGSGRRRLGRAVWNVELTRCRGAEPATWTLGACDEKGRLAETRRTDKIRPANDRAVPARLADGPAQAGRTGPRAATG
ncbi:ImuA family protein [Methylobrevis pamukkalensis]|uniref:SOS cell division inhibitor n=1 Tax=Methylobrevis pamukkalensis TaxID=1439726 RepID=A0A1E3H5Z5_9HYPH|nr:damage-inducible protein [Methylobrevis pamukkalensis]ODN71759.1 hypothetical protein A6302_00902 [Methylobrevis pamukkalensis]